MLSYCFSFTRLYFVRLHIFQLCDDIIGEQYTGTRVGEKTMVSGTITGDEVEVVPKKAQEVVFDRIPAKVHSYSIFFAVPMIILIIDLKARY